MNGLGWPAEAKTTHAKHGDYAKRAILAYMPCPGFAGTDYIHTMVAQHFNNDWREALRSFALDPKNRWCPTWLRHNYEIQNDVLCGFPNEDLPPPPAPSGSTEEPPAPKWPWSHKYKHKFIFPSGEPPANQTNAEEEELSLIHI